MTANDNRQPMTLQQHEEIKKFLQRTIDAAEEFLRAQYLPQAETAWQAFLNHDKKKPKGMP